MKAKKQVFIISMLFINLTVFGQQIGRGYPSANINNFNIDMPSGFYQGINNTGGVSSAPTGGVPSVLNGSPWQHLLNLRHNTTTNTHQLQIASSYDEDGKLFFRKFARNSLGVANPAPVWNEVATRGVNTFIGDQRITGKLEVTGNGLFQGGLTSSITSAEGGSISFINPSKTANGLGREWKIYNMTGVYGNSLQFYVYDNLGCVGGGLCSPRMTLLDNGKVGIGTTKPDKELTVNGVIHSKEVIVDTNVPADYVFQKYYTGKSALKSDYVMPTLREIESFTKENHHLPNVPSAKEIQQNGLPLGEMSNVLLQKIEELTLYAIEQQKELESLKTENEKYIALAERLSAVEKEFKK